MLFPLMSELKRIFASMTNWLMKIIATTLSNAVAL
jgi:hypothetical protein